jgi:protein involved in sex pheromone biosynthesis
MRIKLLMGVFTSILMLIGCESEIDKSSNEDKVIQQQDSVKNVKKCQLRKG